MRRSAALDLLGGAVADPSFPPVSLVVFGSFARSDADEQSDIDAIVVRPGGVDPDDVGWVDGIEHGRVTARAITGNRVEILELSCDEVRERLGGDATLWRDVQRDGIVVYGLPLNELRESANA